MGNYYSLESIIPIGEYIMIWETDNNASSHWGAEISTAGPFFETAVNQTNFPGDPETVMKGGWPWDPRQTFATVSGFWDC
jgi:hypothetical protein